MSLYCYVPWIKNLKYISNIVVWRITGNVITHRWFGTYVTEMVEHTVCCVWHWSPRSCWNVEVWYIHIYTYIYIYWGAVHTCVYNLDIWKLSISKQACNSYVIFEIVKKHNTGILCFIILFILLLFKCITKSASGVFEGIRHKALTLFFHWQLNIIEHL